MDVSVARRLIFAKYQLHAGKRELANNSDFGAGEAVLRFHDALETFLLAVADHVGLPRARVDFHQQPTRIAKHTKTPFLHLLVVNEINDVRLPTKHHGKYPPFRHVHDLASRIDAVFQDNAVQYLGVSFTDVRMASSILHPITSEHVRLAEDALTVGDYLEAMKHLAAAFDIFMGCFRSYGLPESAARSIQLPNELLDEREVGRWLFKDPNQQRVLAQINKRWKDASEQLELAMLSVNLADYATFRYLCPTVHLNDFNGIIGVYDGHGERLRFTRENAEFCLNFVLQIVSHLQGTTSVRDVHSFYDLRVILAMPFFRSGEYQKPEGELTVGQEIKHATLGLGPGEMGECWSWEQATTRFIVRADACEIERELRRRDYWDQKHKAEALQRAAENPRRQ